MEVPFPLTSTIYGISGLLLLIATAALSHSYLKSKILLLKQLTYMFLFFALFLLSFSLPAYFFPEKATVIAYGFIVGILFAYGILFWVIRIGRDVDIHLFRKLAFMSTMGITVAFVIAVFLLLYDFRMPITGKNGVILWNVSLGAKYLLSIACLYAGSMWSYCFYKAGKIVWQKDRVAAIKFFIFANNGITCGISALLVFSATVEWVSLVGLGLMGFACMITMVIFLLPSKISKKALQ